jgi:hypothetical protein
MSVVASFPLSSPESEGNKAGDKTQNHDQDADYQGDYRSLVHLVTVQLLLCSIFNCI